MGMPTNTKTWIHDTNNVVNTGNLTNDVLTLLLAYVRFLIDVCGCTMVRCSYYDTGDSTQKVANGDFWTSIGNLVYSTSTSTTENLGVRSWCVIRLPSIFGTNVELMIHLRRYSTSYTTVAVKRASAGYDLTTGTTSSYPSILAGGFESVIRSYPTGNATSNFCPATAIKKIWNSSISSDGECFRFWIMSESVCSSYFEIAKFKNPVPELVTPKNDWFICWSNCTAAAPTDCCSYAKLYGASDTYFQSMIVGTAGLTLETSGECRAGNTNPAPQQYVSVPNPQDNDAYPILPIGFWCSNSVSYAYGRHGEWFDAWWGVAPLANGSTFPGDGSKTHIKLGEALIVPWEAGVIPTIA